MPRAGELIVRLKQAKGIKGDEAFGFRKADLFANLSLGGEKRTSNVVIDGGSDTVWNEEFRFKIAAHVNIGLYESLTIFIYHQDYYGDIRRGTAKIDVKNLLEEHEDEVPNREYPVVFHGQKRGGLLVGFTFKPVNGVPVVQPGMTSFDRDGSTSETLINKIRNKIRNIGNYRKPKKYAIFGPQDLRREPVKWKEEKEEEKPMEASSWEPMVASSLVEASSWEPMVASSFEEASSVELEEAYSIELEEAYSMEHEEENHTGWASESESEYESVQSPPGEKRTADGCSILTVTSSV